MTTITRTLQGIVPSVPTTDGAGVKLRRSLGQSQQLRLDPFLMLDEFSSDNPNDYIAGFPSHPHRGFETVTYMLDGHMLHEDHLGNRGELRGGGAQWMTAGRGVIHSEIPQQDSGLMHGFQLWVNLPADLKMTPPRYQEVAPGAVQVIASADGLAQGRIVAGEALGVVGPIATTLPTAYQHWRLNPGAAVALPIAAAQRVAAYIFRGSARLGATATRVDEGGLAVMGPGELVRFGADADGPGADLLLMAAAPLNEPVARRGPFVMNTEAELSQAFADYRAGRMGSIPPG
jgi:redox-sensitive bicupin YhaK (pirin superfamily)